MARVTSIRERTHQPFFDALLSRPTPNPVAGALTRTSRLFENPAQKAPDPKSTLDDDFFLQKS
jgi:hypothetical protein